MENLTRERLSIDYPLPEQAARWLLSRAETVGNAADLSRCLVLVPTQTAGRRLRQWLAWEARGDGLGGVLLPRIVTPPQFVELGTETCLPAGNLEVRLAWMHVLSGIDPERFPALFPIAPRQPNDLSWQSSIADSLIDTRQILGEAGLLFADLALRGDIPEARRWAELAALEKQFTAHLRQRGLRDRESLRKELASASPSLSDDYHSIVLAGVPDPLPLAVARLEREAQSGMPVQVLVYCDGDVNGRAQAFDAWGRPGTLWSRRAMPFADFTTQVHSVVDPAQQAREVASLVAQSGACSTAVGLLDPTLERLLTNRLTHEEQSTFNPSGQLLRECPTIELLQSLVDGARERTVTAAGRLLRCPDILAAMENNWQSDRPFDSVRLLDDWDRMVAAHLPEHLDSMAVLIAKDTDWWHAQRTLRSRRTPCSELKYAFKFVVGLIDEIKDESTRSAKTAHDTLESLLLRIYGKKNFADDGNDGDARFEVAISSLLDAVATIDGDARWKPLPTWQTLEFAVHHVASQRHFPPRPETDTPSIDLQGWLELLWEEKPHVILAGFNEGIVPETVTSHAFLPESVRELLALTTNAHRFQRDAYLLSTLLSAHHPDRGGRLDVVLGRESANKDPRRPSRLLLICADEEFARRVQQLFASGDGDDSTERASAPVAPWTAAWRLRVPATDPPDGLAVTAFRDYLACPYRFFLTRQLGMRPVDPAKAEMDAMDFGNVIHGVLEQMGRNEVMRDCTDALAIRSFLCDALDTVVRERYGEALPLPVSMQTESARSRLDALAQIQAAERANGWRIHGVEVNLHEHADFAPIQVGGLTLRGVIDRIETHERTGEWRVLDYKTSNQADDPAKKHWRPLYRARPEHLRDYAFFDHNGAICYWADLQLPLYCMALQQWYGALPQCGYFNLPKQTADTGIKPLPLDEALFDAAQICAEGIVSDIRAGRFAPTSDKVLYDQFERLLFNRPSETTELAGPLKTKP